MRWKITCIIAFIVSIWPVFTANAVGGCGANTVNCITPNSDSTSSVQITKADGTTNVFNVDTTNARVGIGTITPSVSLDLGSKSDAILLPTGNNTTRPTGIAGMLRFNTNSNAVEAYNGTAWSSLGGSSSVTLGTSASATSPQISGDATSGLFSSAASTIQIATAGSERLRVTATGAVGIGTTAPNQQLDVNGNINAGTSLASGYYINNIKILSMPVSATNIALGNTAMPNITTGTYNSAIGFSAGQYISTGNYNIALGASALGGSSSTSVTGSYNIAQGYGAGYFISSGGGNIALGRYALSGSTTTPVTGYNNIAQGYYAGQYFSSGDGNIALGLYALQGSSSTPVTGYYNVAQGNTAGRYISTGSNNIALGVSALSGSSSTPVIGDYNIAQGYYAGKSISSGSNNVILGYQVGSTTLTTGSNNILIGTSSAVDTTASNSSNQLNIGNTIYGDLANARIGIGSATINTGASLDLSSRTDSVLLPNGTTAQRPTAAAGMIRYNSSNNVLEAYYNSNWNTLLGSTSTTGYSGTTILGTSAAATSPQISGDATSGVFSSAASTIQIATAGSERLRVTATGSVGIGTTAPNQQLDVNGNINAGSSLASGYYINNIKILTMPSDNTNIALGGAAMPNITTGTYNSAMGYSAGQYISTGYEDIALGAYAGQNITTGSGNIALGVSALSGSGSTPVTGLFNIVQGYVAGQYISSGSGNIALGYYALSGSSSTPVTGSFNVVQGYQAGVKISSGSQNVILGKQVASTTLTTGSNNILIGTSNAVDTTAANSSNQLNIGNTIFGDLANARVGIGSATINSGASLDLSSRTDSVLLPNGTTAQRPTATAGMIRYNSSTGALEAYNGTSWGLVGNKGGAPTISSCGTSASVTGNDSAFKVTVGTGTVTSCTINFNTTWAAAPSSCVFSAGNAGAASALASPSYSVYISTLSTTQFALTSSTSIASAVFYVQCR